MRPEWKQWNNTWAAMDPRIPDYFPETNQYDIFITQAPGIYGPSTVSFP
jgi:hypothetical protein